MNDIKKVFTTPIGIVLYPHLAEPTNEGNPAKPKDTRKISLIIKKEDQESAEMAELLKAIQAKIAEKFGDKTANLKLPLKPLEQFGGDKTQEAFKKAGLHGQGNFVFTAKTKFNIVDPEPPYPCSVYGPDGNPMSKEDITKRIVHGSLGRAKVTIYAYDNTGNRGIGLGLSGYQYYMAGDLDLPVSSGDYGFDTLQVPLTAMPETNGEQAPQTAPSSLGALFSK